MPCLASSATEGGCDGAYMLDSGIGNPIRDCIPNGTIPSLGRMAGRAGQAMSFGDHRRLLAIIADRWRGQKCNDQRSTQATP